MSSLRSAPLPTTVAQPSRTGSRGSRAPQPWPRWSSAALIASGSIAVGFDTASLLAVVGLGFVGVGVFGLLGRAPHGRSRSSGSARG